MGRFSLCKMVYDVVDGNIGFAFEDVKVFFYMEIDNITVLRADNNHNAALFEMGTGSLQGKREVLWLSSNAWEK